MPSCGAARPTPIASFMIPAIRWTCCRSVVVEAVDRRRPALQDRVAPLADEAHRGRAAGRDLGVELRDLLDLLDLVDLGLLVGHATRV